MGMMAFGESKSKEERKPLFGFIPALAKLELVIGGLKFEEPLP